MPDSTSQNPALKYPDAVDREAIAPAYHGKNRKLYVVSCISNPLMFKTRIELYKQFAQMVEDAGAILYTTEMAYGDRPFEITSPDNIRHVQVRSNSMLWHKENMLNLAIQQLPDDWEYVAFVDADISFTNPNWVVGAIELLQHYKFIQLFSHAQDLSPTFEPMKMHTGFYHDYINNPSFSPGGKYAVGHPGYAHATTRSALDKVGGLLDWAILGSADRHMCCGLIGRMEDSLVEGLHSNYVALAMEWQRRAEKYIKRNVGYLPGIINHHFHGPKAARQYMSRWKILVDNQFDPVNDIYKDTQGIWQLDDDNIGLRDGLRRYFATRHEDSAEVPSKPRF